MATATAAAPMAISQNLLLTLPPPTRSDFRGRTGGEYPLLLTDFQATRFRFGIGSPAPLTMRSGRSGGTGRRAGLKIRFPPGSVGSIPTFGTEELSRNLREGLVAENPKGCIEWHRVQQSPHCGVVREGGNHEEARRTRCTRRGDAARLEHGCLRQGERRDHGRRNRPGLDLLPERLHVPLR